MSTQTLSDSFENAVISQKSSELYSILHPQKSIAIWKREILELKQEIETLLAFSTALKATGTVEEIKTQLENYLLHSSNISSHRFCADVTQLLELFANIAKSESYTLTINSINNNMCRRFHTDLNDLRLLCTYVGPGTLWLPEHAVNRNALGATRSNTPIVKDESLIQTCQAGEVLILKGALFPDALAAVHRSPSIEESGERRLLLRIDTDVFLNFFK